MPYIPSTSYEPGFPIDWEGLDLQSAIDATPCWYGVSSGNGNDGVSHTWPDYYVRTCEPYRLAELAMVARFSPGEGYTWAIDNVEVDGEADYTISATIYNPPDDDTERDHSECEDGEDCEGCDACEPDGENDYCSANGAWLIVEVFLIENMDDERSRARRYDSLSEAFSADLLMRVTSE